jgi:anti-anti-sigma regulatory factor
VLLRGALSTDQLPALRTALLAPLTADCRDVVVDAAGVTELDAEATSVLLEGRDWAATHGARFLLSQVSTALERALAERGVADTLPRLAPLGGRRGPRWPVPQPRAASPLEQGR